MKKKTSQLEEGLAKVKIEDKRQIEEQKNRRKPIRLERSEDKRGLEMARKLDGWMARKIEEQIARRLEDNKTPIVN